ncbi:hypothetical protein [Solemya pervernicosa gill symbiont]|nr:hypothetical protein [Solemya pervernicosa gill symbiont]
MKHNTINAIKPLDPRITISDQLAYGLPIKTGLVRKIMDGDEKEYYRLSCLDISMEVETFEHEVPASMRNSKRATLALNDAKQLLDEMRKNSLCGDT